MIDKAQKTVSKLCNLKDEYYVLFTSGASESNCTLVHMVVEAWKRNVGTTPHIVSSTIEHKSILECVERMAEDGRVELTLIEPNMYGVIDPDEVDAAIRDSTALVTIMFANNETGAINPVRRIGEIAHRRNVPFHTDAVQIFGKIQVDPSAFNLDALSMSFHKLYGPQGMGMLILKKEFVTGYGLQGQISGTQQHGLRGGTENIPGIAGGAAALVQNFRSRKQKNAKLSQMRELCIQLLAKAFPVVPYREFYNAEDDKFLNRKGKALVILGPENKQQYLPSTLLLSVIDYDKPFCNIKFKKILEDNGIIISIGSACNTNSKSASHVILSIKAPPIVRRGVLRVSFGDFNTLSEVREFARIFINAVKKL